MKQEIALKTEGRIWMLKMVQDSIRGIHTIPGVCWDWTKEPIGYCK